jgi:diguanylate cyclase (GGDEF)-like protein
MTAAIDKTVTDTLYTSRWRKTLIQALPFAIIAFLVGWALEIPSGQQTPLDLIGYPVMAGFLLVLEILLLLDRRYVIGTLVMIIAGSSLFFATKLATILFFMPGVDVQAQLTETFYWVPVIYLLSFIILRGRVGQMIVVAFTVAMLALTFVYAVTTTLNQEVIGIIYSLVQMNLANSVLLALTMAFQNFKADYIRAHARVEIAERYARTDTLTQLPNRVMLTEELERRIAEAADEGGALAVHFIDLDGFKLVNDTMGHEAGDYLLQEVAQRLQGILRDSDFLARISGDEFIIVTPVNESGNSPLFAERIKRVFEAPVLLNGRSFQLTASIGVSHYPQDAHSGTGLLRHADSAMYRVKRTGKNGIFVFDGAGDRELERMRELEQLLREAIGQNQLYLEYQPLYELKSGRLVTLEALIRWRHPELGVVSPADFIPLAEHSGLIIPLGNWVLDEACRQIAAWRQLGMTDVTVSVNVSAVQVAQSNFYDIVASTLTHHGLTGAALELELTERVVLEGLDAVSQTLDKLQRLGVSIAIDDFGTGYSSLAYLENLQVDTIKIDRTFISNLRRPRGEPQFSLALIEAIVSLAGHLDVRVVAEGIETTEQCQLLKTLGVAVGQGYYFSKPLSPEDILLFYRRTTAPAAYSLALVN